MEIIKMLVILMSMPFILAGMLLGGLFVTAVIMGPFQVALLLVVYKFDWREMFDMEFGTSLRKFSKTKVKSPDRPKLFLIKS